MAGFLHVAQVVGAPLGVLLLSVTANTGHVTTHHHRQMSLRIMCTGVPNAHRTER